MPLSQLLTPRIASQALAPAHQALDLCIAQVFGTAWHFVTVHIWDRQLDSEVSSGLSHWAVLGLSTLAQRGWVTAHASLEEVLTPPTPAAQGGRRSLCSTPGKENEVMMKFVEQAQNSNSRCLSAMKGCFLSRGEQWMTECG